WSVQPSTFTFVNGTNATSQDVSIQFQNVGTYQVSLVASNAFGSDTVVTTSAVTVDPGVPVPVFQDFEIPLFPPVNWEIDNPDGFVSWQPAQVTGSNGFTTRTALFDNFSGANSGQSDGLVTMNIDLRNTSSPLLFFDVAHAKRSGREDSLVIDISTNCGFEYQSSSYQKGSSQLQTSASVSTLFVPSSAADWRRDTLDLSPYAGSNIKIRFRNYSDAGNAVYLDNIQLVSSTVQAPSAKFSVSDTLACMNDDLTFIDLSTGGTATSYQWDFGADAVPNAATTAGPHTIKFVRTGLQTVTLTVSNSGGFSQHIIMVDVKRRPLSIFNSALLNPFTVQFNDLSLYDPDEWYWDFGDGDTSSLQNPVHTYDTAGTYTVYQKVTNRCGFTDRTVTVAIISTPEEQDMYAISLYPNPNTGRFSIQMEGIAGQTVDVRITDLSGKLIRNISREVPGGSGAMEFDMNDAAPGVYMIRLQTEKGTHTLRTVIR
ncbi:MAG: PKD domain-containing protein, partial [Owenweeksia sp.]